MSHEHYFLCPHCGNRSMGIDRNAGFRREARGCEKCGFAYLYELLDDYYPAPGTGFVVCDQEGRILAVGRGVFELTGFQERELMGQDVVTALTLSDGKPVELVAAAKPFADTRDTSLAIDIRGLDLTRFIAYVPGIQPVEVRSAQLETT